MQPSGPPEQFEMESFPREYEGSFLPIKVGLAIAFILCFICWGIGTFCYIYGNSIPDQTRNELAFDGPETPRDICQFILPCQNEGMCVVNDNVESGYYCQCENGWMGLNCTLPCVEEQCGENAHCNQSTDDGPDCICTKGFVIKTKYKDGRVLCTPDCTDSQKSECSVEADGNSCMQSVDGTTYECTCKASSYKKDDEDERCIATSECTTRDNANCNQLEGSLNKCIIKGDLKPECVCRKRENLGNEDQVQGEKGDTCVLDVCSIANPCGNGGICYYPNGRMPFKCICPFGWTGNLCDESCSDDICGVGAVCNKTVSCTGKNVGKCRLFRQSNCRCDDPTKVNVYPRTKDGPMACVEDMCHPISPCDLHNTIKCASIEIAPFYKCLCKIGFIGTGCEVTCDEGACGEYAECDYAIPLDVTKGDCRCVEGALEVPGSKDPEEGTIECIPDMCFECSKPQRPGVRSRCPCQNNGRCISNITYPFFDCFCQDWKGPTCEEPCECVTYATCTNTEPLCTCKSGYFSFSSTALPPADSPPTTCYTKNKLSYEDAKAFCQTIGQELKTFTDAAEMKEFLGKEEPYMDRRSPLLVAYKVEVELNKVAGGRIDVGRHLPDYLASDASFDTIETGSDCTTITGTGSSRGIVNVKCADVGVSQVICKKKDRCTGTSCFFVKVIDPAVAFEADVSANCAPEEYFIVKNAASLSEVMRYLRNPNNHAVRNKQVHFPVKIEIVVKDDKGAVFQAGALKIIGGLRGRCLAGKRDGEPAEGVLQTVSCSHPNYFICTEPAAAS